MATGKRYYWLKLKETFLTSDTVDYFMSQKDGANYVVLYQLLCLKTINTGGRLCRQIGEVIIPYDAEKIQRDCKWFSIDTVRFALNLYQSVGLVYMDNDGVLVMADHDNLVGSSTDYSEQKQRQRALKAGESTMSIVDKGVDNKVDIGVDKGVDNVHTDIDIRYKRLDKEKEKRERESLEPSSLRSDGSCPEAEKSAPGRNAVIGIELNDKTIYEVTQKDVDGWQSLYPAVDVMQELRNMKGWCDANPKLRKTRNGFKRFVNAWLVKEQNRGGHRKQPAREDFDWNAYKGFGGAEQFGDSAEAQQWYKDRWKELAAKGALGTVIHDKQFVAEKEKEWAAMSEEEKYGD